MVCDIDIYTASSSSTLPFMDTELVSVSNYCNTAMDMGMWVSLQEPDFNSFGQTQTLLPDSLIHLFYEHLWSTWCVPGTNTSLKHLAEPRRS